jgi:recombination protein RecT
VKARGERGNPFLTYAFAITKDGGFYFEEIDEKQMGEIEKASRAKMGPWKGPFRDEMKRKSAIRRLAKYRLPSSTDLDDIIRRDDEFFDLDGRKAAEAKAKEISQAIRDNPQKAVDAQEPDAPVTWDQEPFQEEPGANG